MDILHDDVDVQVQHPVDGHCIDEITAPLDARVCMKDVKLPGLFQGPRQQRSANPLGPAGQ
jgi:hypothetical protein